MTSRHEIMMFSCSIFAAVREWPVLSAAKATPGFQIHFEKALAGSFEIILQHTHTDAIILIHPLAGIDVSHEAGFEILSGSGRYLKVRRVQPFFYGRIYGVLFPWA